MKILIVMAGFFPGQKYGGPPVSVDNFCTLMNNHECYIVTRNHDMGDTEAYSNIKSGWNDRSNCKVLYLSNKEYGYKKYKEVIQEIKPDIIYLQGLFQNCVIPCLILAKKFKISVLLAPRGELCKGAFKKKYKKIPYIIFLKLFRLKSNVNFQSTSIEETEAISNILGVSRSKIFYLSNIPSLPKKKYNYKEKKKDEVRLVFLSRIVSKKNLDFALECLMNVDGRVYLDIFGSIEDNEFWNKCKIIINKLPNNISVIYKGSLDHELVHEMFSQYDAFFFPTKSENYGHVIVEAMSVGCPVIISDQVPWTDVENYGAGWSIPLSNPELYIKVIQNLVKCDDKMEMLLRKNAIRYFESKSNLIKLKQNYQDALSNNS